MATIKIEIKNIERLHDALSRSPQTVGKHMQEAIQLASMIYFTEVQRIIPADTSNMARTTRRDIFPLRAEIYPTASYAAAVHEGTRPHYVSPEALKRWAAHKGLNPYAVAKSIAKKGTKSQPFMINAFDKVQNDLPGPFEKAIDKILNEITEGL